MFTNKMEFNFDEQDGQRYYWWDLCCEPEICSKRAQEGGQVMAWGAIFFYGVINSVGIERNMIGKTFASFCKTCRLTKRRNLWMRIEFFGSELLESTLYTTAERGQRLMTSFCLPGRQIHPIWTWKKTFGNVLARKVYQNGHQFNDFLFLHKATMKVWNETSIDYLQSLNRLTPSRLVAVQIKKKTNFILSTSSLDQVLRVEKCYIC